MQTATTFFSNDTHTVKTCYGGVDLLSLHERFPQRYPYLLESVARGNSNARFDILFAYPTKVLKFPYQDRVWCADNDNFFQQLDVDWNTHSQPPPACEFPIPFYGGWFLFLGYELAKQIESTLVLPAADDELPIAYACRCPAAIVQDHVLGCCHLLVESEHKHCLPQMEQDFQFLQKNQLKNTEYEEHKVIDQLLEEPGEAYIQRVYRAKEYIRNGDVFQVNLARKWNAIIQHGITAVDIYRRLRITNPAPFAGIANIDGNYILSSSPERLVRVSEQTIQARPIAGTRPRSSNNSQDRQLHNELLSNPKEQAEHIMLIDLERNDIGRVATAGSVKVNELMVIESYAHVHHIVSNVLGTLKANINPSQIINAMFPGGTITGCPKVRCMEIIAELEGRGRGAYTGSFGYLNCDGSLDLNILIRTFTLQSGRLSLLAGAGIVADSDPHRELEETRAKARGLLLAIT